MDVLTFKHLDNATWSDLQTLFGEKGACGGCWCMHWRSTHRVYQQNKGTGNKEAFRKLVQAGRPLGILGYDATTPIGWCSVSPKPDLLRLRTTRLLKGSDEDAAIWSITCLFVHDHYRSQGISAQLIAHACSYAFSEGASLVEAYPIVPKKIMPPAFAWVGFAGAFEKAGFQLFKQVSETRLVMRKTRD